MVGRLAGLLIFMGFTSGGWELLMGMLPRRAAEFMPGAIPPNVGPALTWVLIFMGFTSGVGCC